MIENKELSIVNSETYKTFVERLLFFNKISQNILEKKPLIDVLNEIIKSSKLLLDAEASSLLLYDDNKKNLYFHTISGTKENDLKKRTVKLGEGIAGWVAESKSPLKIDDCYNDARFNKDFDVSIGFRTRNMICAPMIRKNDLVGVIQVINKKDNGVFSEEDFNLFTALASECALAIENARLSEVEIKTEQIRYELSIAHDIQQKLIPKQLPQFDDIDLKTVFIPAKEVGGDYYNVIKIDDSKTLFLIVDVTGKSVPAALIVSTIYSFITTYFIVSKNDFDLRSFVTALNRFLVLSTTEDKFATAWFGVYDHKEKLLESVNAGHNPILLFKNGGDKIELNKGGLFLGSLDMPYENEFVNPGKNDLLLFYTDGITEAMSALEEEYSDERFEKLIWANTDKDADNLAKIILSDIREFCTNCEQSDDITYGIIKFG